MPNVKCSIAFIILLVFVSPVYVPITVASVSESEASSALTSAEATAISAYHAVLTAENAGANVSDLLVQLNAAGELLAQAKMAYRLGDFDETVRSAGLCSAIAESVKNRADELNVEASRSGIPGFWVTLTASLVGIAAVSFGSFEGWRLFKRRYYKRVLRTVGG